ncbi:unnamed protein product [Lactuca saligna]|uniref:Uncharacterized protein n=1 Tax=Lactuca saligna TaxID=75948 RepID=A0AA36DW56_LACSI|nr:unnamed protein product [Lactuca saligna]
MYYGYQSKGTYAPLDLSPLLVVEHYSVEGEEHSTQIKQLHQEVFPSFCPVLELAISFSHLDNHRLIYQSLHFVCHRAVFHVSITVPHRLLCPITYTSFHRLPFHIIFPPNPLSLLTLTPATSIAEFQPPSPPRESIQPLHKPYYSIPHVSRTSIDGEFVSNFPSAFSTVDRHQDHPQAKTPPLFQKPSSVRCLLFGLLSYLFFLSWF